jgi:uncharacterized membrane protein YczE
MFKKFTSPGFDSRFHLQILKTLLITINIIVFVLYGLLRLMFYDFPFEIIEEAVIGLKLLGIGTTIALGASLIIIVADGLDYLIRNRSEINFPAYQKSTVAVSSVVLLLLVLFS